MGLFEPWNRGSGRVGVKEGGWGCVALVYACVSLVYDEHVQPCLGTLRIPGLDPPVSGVWGQSPVLGPKTGVFERYMGLGWRSVRGVGCWECVRWSYVTHPPRIAMLVAWYDHPTTSQNPCSRAQKGPF